MKPLRTRNDLTALAAQHAPSNACAKAISENRATVLGGFTPVEGLPSYIVHVCSFHKREWIIAVLVDEAADRFRIRYLDEVPWSLWIGKIGGTRPLIDGDHPTESAYKRMRSVHGHAPDSEIDKAE